MGGFESENFCDSYHFAKIKEKLFTERFVEFSRKTELLPRNAELLPRNVRNGFRNARNGFLLSM